MKIVVNFFRGTSYWKNLVNNSAQHASQILSDDAFLEKIRAWPRFDYCSDTPTQVADKIRGTDDLNIYVGFYSSWWTRAIAYEESGSVYFNTRKEGYGAGGVGNVSHEVMHALGYSHNGNSPSGNENSVPYRIGEWASSWIIPAGTAPSASCPPSERPVFPLLQPSVSSAPQDQLSDSP